MLYFLNIIKIAFVHVNKITIKKYLVFKFKIVLLYNMTDTFLLYYIYTIYFNV